MFVVENNFCAKHTKDNSVFIAYLIPIKYYDSFLCDLKKEHKKAVHFVRANRILNQYLQIVEYSSDDGEPKGSAGIPILNVMRGNSLINCGIIIVRYFGGKLLGVGGLLRAYTNSALSVIKESKLIEFEEIQSYSLKLPFNKIEIAKYIAKKLEINTFTFDFMDSFVVINIDSTSNKIEEFKKLITL